MALLPMVPLGLLDRVLDRFRWRVPLIALAGFATGAPIQLGVGDDALPLPLPATTGTF